MTPLPDAADLAAQSRWIRALARSLVADAALADDLVQDTWMAALRNPPSRDRPLRGWLATVLRRRLAERRRETASRERREEIAARREALPSTLDMVERAAVQRDLAGAVLELDEPYRTAILWRFFEEVSPREIARRSGAPIATVHSRIQRGLEKLRRRLDRDRGGDGRAWALALAPLVRTGSPGPAFLGALIVKTSTQVAIAAACAAMVAAFVLWRDDATDANEPASISSNSSATSPTVPPAASEDGPPVRAFEVEEPDPSSSGRIVGEATKPPTTAPAVTAEPAVRLLRGQVLDETGRARGGIALRLSPAGAGSKPFRSDAAGRFETALSPSADSVVSDDERFSTVLAGSARLAPGTESVVVVAPRVDLAGTVVAEDGAALQGAELSIRVPRSFGADFGRSLDAAVEQGWRAVSDTSGAFALPGVPSVEGAALHVSHGGFEPLVEPVPATSDSGVRIVLRRPRAGTGRLTGIVVDPGGGLVRGARVSAGWETTFTDSGGRFELDVAKTPPPLKVTAAKRGFLPGEREAERRDDGSSAWPEHVVLRLGEEPRSIEGRVVDGEGRAVRGARVWLEDPTYFGIVGNEPVPVETLLGREDAPFWAFVTTAGDGAFRLEGLLERSYRLRAIDPRTLLAASSEPVEAGMTGVEIRLPRNALYEKVKGRVLTRDGTPVADVSVQVQRFALSVEFPGGGTRDEFAPRPPVKTDAEGRFEIADVPKKDVELFAYGDAILFEAVDVKEGMDVEDVRIVVSRRMHLQVELDAPIDRADELRVLDADGKPMILRIMRGETSFTDRKAAIVDGRSHVLSTSEEARTVVLSKAGAEVARVPVALRAGELNVVRH